MKKLQFRGMLAVTVVLALGLMFAGCSVEGGDPVAPGTITVSAGSYTVSDIEIVGLGIAEANKKPNPGVAVTVLPGTYTVSAKVKPFDVKISLTAITVDVEAGKAVTIKVEQVSSDSYRLAK